MSYLSSKLSKKILFAGLILSGLSFVTIDLRADYIYLNDGTVISGVLIEEKEKLLVYRAAYGEMFISRENISKIIPEGKDKPLLREAGQYLKDKNFKRAIKTCGEVLEIRPDSVEALELKQKAITAWRDYEAKREEKVSRKEKKIEQKAGGLKEAQEGLKTKWGIAIRKEEKDYIIADVYSNCPLRRDIKPGDNIAAVDNTKAAELSINNIYNLLLTSKKIALTVQRPIVLIREKIYWHGQKSEVSFGMTFERVTNGIKIIDLMPNGPADKAGISVNDIIISLGGFPISSFTIDKLLKGEIGTTLNAVIEREVTLK